MVAAIFLKNFYLLILKIYLFIFILSFYFCLCWVFVMLCQLFSSVADAGYFAVAVCRLLSHCSDFSCGAWPLGHAGFSSCGFRALEHRLCSSGTRT